MRVVGSHVRQGATVPWYIGPPQQENIGPSTSRHRNSSGIAFLIQCARYGQEQSLSVTLPDPAPVVAELLSIVGADHRFPPQVRPN